MVTKVITDNTTGGDYTGTEDSTLVSAVPTLVENTNTQMFVYTIGGGDVRSGVIRFTGLSNITGPVTVSSATLSLYRTNGDDGHPIEIYKLLRAWVDSQVCWNDYATSTAWQTAGATGALDKEAAASVSTNTSGGINAYQDFTSAQLATDVENFINTPSSNNGWLVSQGGAGAQLIRYASEDGTDATRPKLTVVYTDSGNTTTTAWIRA